MSWTVLETLAVMHCFLLWTEHTHLAALHLPQNLHAIFNPREQAARGSTLLVTLMSKLFMLLHSNNLLQKCVPVWSNTVYCSAPVSPQHLSISRKQHSSGTDTSATSHTIVIICCIWCTLNFVHTDYSVVTSSAIAVTVYTIEAWI